MKKITICIIFLLGTCGFSQITLIPDPNFEQALIDLGIDSDGVINGQVLTSDVVDVTYLEVNDREISNLTGIEDFISIEILFCRDNLLTELNTSNNLLLKELYCGGNNYTNNFDLSSNVQLLILECRYCNLSALDLTNNVMLEILFCGNEFDLQPFNTFTELDLSNNVNLIELRSSEMFYLESLDLSNNPLLEYVDVSNSFIINTGLAQLNVTNGNNNILVALAAYDNPLLFCIQVDDENAANNGDPPYSGWFVDQQITYSEDCSLGINDADKMTIEAFPNPVQDVINIKNTSNAEITSIRIYDILGRLILEKEEFDQIDVSSLDTGILFMKIETDRGILTKKIIKE